MPRSASRSSRTWLVIAIILFTLLAGYVAIGPFLTLQKIQTGLSQKDTAILENNIDFESLRTSIKAQLSAQMAESTDKALGGNENPMASLAKMFLTQAVDKIVEHSLTAQGLANLMRGQPHDRNSSDNRPKGDNSEPGKPAPSASGNTADQSPPDLLAQADISYDSLNQCSFWITNAKGQHTRIIFTRSGLRWQLTDIRLPQPAD